MFCKITRRRDADGAGNEKAQFVISNYALAYLSTLYLWRMRGRGGGDFLPDPYSVFYGIVVDNLNDDVVLDIAVAMYFFDQGNEYYTPVIVNDSNSPGNFLPLVSSGITSWSAAIADIDGDFINDIALAVDGEVRLLFQDPAVPGNFSAPVILNAGNAPRNVKIGDLDKDGHPDLVVGDATSQDGTPGGVDVLLQDNINPGKFLPAVNYDFGCSTQEISLGDLNNDGFIDVAVASRCSSCKITILFQDMSNIGTFLPAIHYSCIPSEFGFDAWSIAVGDMNDDNFNDLIVSENGVVIRFQDPANSGTFSNRATVYNPN